MRRFSEKKNGENAEHGAAAVEAFMDAYPAASELATDSLLGDLIADVLHYARREGFDPLPILRMAEHHYQEEA